MKLVVTKTEDHQTLELESEKLTLTKEDQKEWEIFEQKIKKWENNLYSTTNSYQERLEKKNQFRVTKHIKG